MKTIYLNNWLAKILLYFSDCHTIMIFGFILSTRSTLIENAINHERIHVRQYWECFVIGLVIACVLACFGIFWGFILPLILFYLMYGIEWAISFIHHYFSRRKKTLYDVNEESYYNSAMEMEAYENEKNPTYLIERTPLRFFKYYGKL